MRAPTLKPRTRSCDQRWNAKANDKTSMIDWSGVLGYFLSTAIIAGAISFLAKKIIDHFFSRDLAAHKTSLDRDIEKYKADLKRQVDLEIAAARTRADQELANTKIRSETELAQLRMQADMELARSKARSDAALEGQRSEVARQMASFQSGLAAGTARADRIREQVVRWANPILGSVMDLTNRLQNVLRNEGYFALSPETEGRSTRIGRSATVTFCQARFICFASTFARSDCCRKV